VSALRADPRFRRMVDHLHQLGPRPVGELLIEIAHKHGIEDDTLDLLEKFAGLDPATVAALEARDWPPLPLRRAS
jgi:hypothetical protein